MFKYTIEMGLGFLHPYVAPFLDTPLDLYNKSVLAITHIIA